MLLQHQLHVNRATILLRVVLDVASVQQGQPALILLCPQCLAPPRDLILIAARRIVQCARWGRPAPVHPSRQLRVLWVLIATLWELQHVLLALAEARVLFRLLLLLAPWAHGAQKGRWGATLALQGWNAHLRALHLGLVDLEDSLLEEIPDAQVGLSISPLISFRGHRMCILCADCQSGYYCPSVTAAITYACKPGSHSTGNGSSCTPALPGFATPNVDSSSSIKCSAGSYSLGHASSCTTCAAGWRCSNTDGSQNVKCIPGTYAVAGKTSCTGNNDFSASK